MVLYDDHYGIGINVTTNDLAISVEETRKFYCNCNYNNDNFCPKCGCKVVVEKHYKFPDFYTPVTGKSYLRGFVKSPSGKYIWYHYGKPPISSECIYISDGTHTTNALIAHIGSGPIDIDELVEFNEFVKSKLNLTKPLIMINIYTTQSNLTDPRDVVMC
jgi:hypothetical protein